MVKRRRFTSEFKARVVLEILSGAKTQAEVAREHRIKPDLLACWKRQAFFLRQKLIAGAITELRPGVYSIRKESAL